MRTLHADAKDAEDAAPQQPERLFCGQPATAGRTVLFSSLTVAGAAASLLVFPQRFLYSMGLAGAFVSVLAAAIALTFLPALLALLGRRVNALAPGVLARRAEREARPAQDGFWYRLARLVMRFPRRTVVGAAVLSLARRRTTSTCRQAWASTCRSRSRSSPSSPSPSCLR